jgi:hypothetical protein
MNGDRRTLTEIVHSRLIQVEDIIKEQDYGPIYYLLQKISPCFQIKSDQQRQSTQSHQYHQQQLYQQQQHKQQQMSELLELVLGVQGSNTSQICCWFFHELHLQITEGEANLLKQYVKICSRSKSFSSENYEIFFPPHISEYSTWCKHLRYLRSLPSQAPPPLRKEKSSQTVANTPHPSRPSSPLQTPRLPSLKKLSHQRSLQSIAKNSSTLNSSFIPSSAQSLTQLSAPAPATALAPLAVAAPVPSGASSLSHESLLKFPTIVRLVAAENKKIRQEVFQILGVN